MSRVHLLAPTCRINPPTQSSRLGFKTHTLVGVFCLKSTTRVWSLRALKKEKLLPRHSVVCREPERRTADGIELLPWQEFMQELWSGRLL